MNKLKDIEEVRNILKSTLDKIGEELEWEYQDITAEQSTYIRPQKSDTDTIFIEEYKGIIE